MTNFENDKLYLTGQMQQQAHTLFNHLFYYLFEQNHYIQISESLF